jgi:predicted Zn-dependent peptidase
MLNEMRRLRDEPVDVREMERAARYIAYGLPRSFESTEDIAAHIREQLLHGFAPDYWTTYVDHILAVTPDQVRNAAARHLHPERATAVVVADRASIEKKLEEFHLGDVVITEVET